MKEILKIPSEMPFFLCTGFNEKIDEIKTGEIGIADYIEKPIDKHDFGFKVRKDYSECQNNVPYGRRIISFKPAKTRQ